MSKTQDLINELQKIEVSEKDKEIIMKVCEHLAYLGNKINSFKK